MVSNFIITTTINKPTQAIILYANIAHTHDNTVFVIVGDLKTPHEYYINLENTYRNVVYLSPENQQDLDVELSDAIGWNCIQRRNFGVLYAYQQGAEKIALVDDDNIPYDFWYSIMFSNNTYLTSVLSSSPVLVNILDFFKIFMLAGENEEKYNYAPFYGKLWVRGFPFETLFSNYIDTIQFSNISEIIEPDILIGLWDGCPDFDAVCRSLYPTHKFKFIPKFESYYLYLRDKITPFNSQNTVLSRRVLPYYFLFPAVGRMDDIFAGYYTISKTNPRIMVTRPTVYQERNFHDLGQDFSKELLGYEHNRKLISHILHGDLERYLFGILPARAKKSLEIWQRNFCTI